MFRARSYRHGQGGGIDSKTRHNALFLSVAAQFNVEIAEKILDWLTRKLKIISGLDDISYYTVSYLAEGNDNRSDIIQLIKKLDLGIREITVKETEIRLNSLPLPEDTSEELKKMIVKSGIVKATLIKTVHQKFDSQGNHISLELFDLYEQESEGTQKIVSIAGILVDTFKNGDVLIFDEFVIVMRDDFDLG